MSTKMRSLLLPLVAVVVFGLVGRLSAAIVLYTTQNDFANAASASGTNVTVAPSALGDSDGSTTNGVGNTTNPGGVGLPGSLEVTQNVTGYNQVNLGNENTNVPFLDALASNTLLSISYYLPQSITFSTTGSNYFQLIPVFNWSGGYQQMSNNSFFTQSNLTAGYHTVTFDYSAFQPGLPTTPPSYFQLFVAVNSGGVQADGVTPTTGIIYLDDIQVSSVPEPASMGLLALSGIGLLRRRRIHA